ncbi:MAG: hypothetical protein RBU30_20720, partial [Polyangia bacterium]|nr:hypothetical protein [Polyangia bacterium]
MERAGQGEALLGREVQRAGQGGRRLARVSRRAWPGPAQGLRRRQGLGAPGARPPRGAAARALEAAPACPKVRGVLGLAWPGPWES